jgi:prepilin-type N-terminal cleavage/methylation domain-containing protein
LAICASNCQEVKVDLKAKAMHTDESPVACGQKSETGDAKSSGFTLVELLVVITIIGILVALLLPAVQAAREAARRAQCANNLKQIGLAMHMHLEANQAFPYGHFWPKNDWGGREATWITSLLPYLEQRALYETIDWSLPFGQAHDTHNPPWNLQANKTPLALLFCPSNGPAEPIITNASGQKCYARGTYAANNGLGPMAECTKDDVPIKRSRQVSAGGSAITITGAALAGVFYINSRLKAADVSDGLSNTAFASEVIAVPGEDFRGMLHYPEGCLYQHDRTPNSAVPDEIRSNYCVNFPHAPCTETFWDAYHRDLTVTARSQHPGGMQLLVGDGSVRFVGDSVALKVWWALCTPKAIPGEVISLDY